jgi:hypothetical protein
LADKGFGEQEAIEIARHFILSQHKERDDLPSYTGPLPKGYQGEYKLFSARVLYPLLASVFYDRAGLNALSLVSALAYVASSVVLFALLLNFAGHLPAALTAVAVMLSPLLRDLSVEPLTDSLAFFFWVALLLTIVVYVREPRLAFLLALFAASAALMLTRPALFLPAGAACGLMLRALRTGDPDAKKTAAAVLLSVGAAALVYAIAALIYHAPGPAAQIRFLYEGEARPSYSIWHWYTLALALATIYEPVRLLSGGIPVLSIAVAVLGMTLRRGDARRAALIGGAAAALVAIPLSPLALDRAFELPLYPMFAVGTAIALADLSAMSTSRAAGQARH